ncbi:MAG: NAD-dependent epimerase/dehydratase family protein [Heliobacteriaceae bacterium]|nr:NAD-dependent epimerase/dehydratase family protein [Heliobacteriaceae bacterium]
MNILVTGGAGFIGSHIVEQLLTRGHRVTVVDNLATGRREHVSPAARFFRQDVCSPDLPALVAAEQPVAVIHLAAQVDVQVSLRDPVTDARVNVLGTLNVLESCRQAGVKRVVLASSAAVYGDPVQLPVTEDHPVAPVNFYGITKHTPEHYLKVYCHLAGFSGAVLRYANVYGPRQGAGGEGGVVAIFTRRFLAGKPPVIFGDGKQTRDFVYVTDVAQANVLAVEAPEPVLRPLIFNVSTGKPVTVNVLYALLQELTGAKAAPVYNPVRPGDILHSHLANERIKTALDWQPVTDLQKGLRQTVAFMRQAHN